MHWKRVENPWRTPPSPSPQQLLVLVSTRCESDIVGRLTIQIAGNLPVIKRVLVRSVPQTVLQTDLRILVEVHFTNSTQANLVKGVMSVAGHFLPIIKAHLLVAMLETSRNLFSRSNQGCFRSLDG